MITTDDQQNVIAVTVQTLGWPEFRKLESYAQARGIRLESAIIELVTSALERQ